MMTQYEVHPAVDTIAAFAMSAFILLGVGLGVIATGKFIMSLLKGAK